MKVNVKENVATILMIKHFYCSSSSYSHKGKLNYNVIIQMVQLLD
jgi:hypothetical protein